MTNMHTYIATLSTGAKMLLRAYSIPDAALRLKRLGFNATDLRLA